MRDTSGFCFFIISFIFQLSASACTPSQPAIPQPQPVPASRDRWIPSSSDSFQLQFASYPVDLSINADIYSVDLFETPPETIAALHEKGSKVLCYLNAGAWEEYRPDAGDFPPEAVGVDYTGWPGEKWLDVGRFELFSAVMENRLDLAVRKGCDGVDPDNIQGYQADTGFSITADDQLEYNLWLSSQAHSRGLAVALKNDEDQVPDLVDHFDLAIVEDCLVYHFCDAFLPFIKQGKPVFQIEYTDQLSSSRQLCPAAEKYGYFGILKRRELDSWAQACK